MDLPKTLVVLESIHGKSLYRRIFESELPQQHLPPEQGSSFSRQESGHFDVSPSMQLETHDIPDSVKRVAHHIRQAGGKPLLVGGSVRDKLHNKIHGTDKPVKDFDIEVYGMHPSHLHQHLEKIGDVNAVGKSFGVLKMKHGGEEFDISVPRRESKSGRGHKGFIPKPDPNMTLSEASRRRDFTMNAVSMDPLTGHVYDPHGGVKDIHKRVLRHTDKSAFAEDPLRVLRGAQFAARFGMDVHPETMQLMRAARHELPSLPKERLGEEWRKLLLKGEKPSHGLRVMKKSGALEVLHPELHALEGIPQDPEYHPEGGVWKHTKHVVDRAANLTRGMDPKKREAIIYSALLHDIAKPHKTETAEGGRITSHGHEEAGGKIAPDILRNQFDAPNHLIEKVSKLVSDHLKPHTFYLDRDKVTDRAIRRLAKRLHPASIEELSHVAHADHTGRGEKGPQEFPAGEWLRDRAKGLQVHKSPMKPILMGRHLIKMGMKPGPRMGQILKQVEKLQERGQVKTLEDATQAAKEIMSQGQQQQESLRLPGDFLSQAERQLARTPTRKRLRRGGRAAAPPKFPPVWPYLSADQKREWIKAHKKMKGESGSLHERVFVEDWKKALAYGMGTPEKYGGPPEKPKKSSKSSTRSKVLDVLKNIGRAAFPPASSYK